MSAHSDRSPMVRRCTLLVTALAALSASLAALPHPHDLAATAVNEPPPPEDPPTIIVTGERVPPVEHLRVTLPAPRSTEQPGDKSLTSIGEFVRQVFGSAAAHDAPSSGRTPSSKPRSEEPYRTLPGEETRTASSSSEPTTRAGLAQPADAGKTLPSLSPHVASLAGASSTYGPHAVSGVLDYIVNKHCEGIRTASAYGFYNHSSAPAGHNPKKPRSAQTFADRVSTTLQMFSVTPGQRPAT